MAKKAQPLDVYIGSRIRRRRNEISMSQEELGRRVGLTFQQIQKYEKGVNRVGGSRMGQIADALQVAPVYFFEGAPGMKGSKPEQDKYAPALARKDVQALLDKFLTLAPGKRDALLGVIETM